MTAMPNFRRGVDESAKAAKSSGPGNRIDYWKIEDGQTHILRFLTDAWPHWINEQTGEVAPYEGGVAPDPSGAWVPRGGVIVVNNHSFVKTKAKPEGYNGKWPSTMGAVCRNDVAFKGIFDGCYICDSIPKADGKPNNPFPRTYALAFLREEVRENGILKGYKTKTKEVEIGGKKVVMPEIVSISQGEKNFFTHIRGYAEHYGTLLDRDFRITRVGSGTDTTYNFVPVDAIPNGDEATQEAFPHYSLRNPAVASKFGTGDYCPADAQTLPSLVDVVMDQVSDDYYHKFFDARVTYEFKGAKADSSGGDGDQAQSRPATDASDDPEAIAAMVSRIKGHDGSQAAPPSQEAQPEPQQAPAEGQSGALASTDFDS